MAFDMQENNKVGFDMTKVKVGDKLVQRGGTVVELDRVRTDGVLSTTYSYVLSDGSATTENGFYWQSEELYHLDIIGFAAEQSTSATKDQQASCVSEEMQTNCSFTEMQAVELLLSLGYTLKKGV